MASLVPVFLLQVVIALVAFFLAARVARARRWIWISVCVVSLGAMLLWPLMRVFPVHAIRWFGAGFVACVELTALAIPAVLLFGIAARHVPRKSDQRAILWLTAAAGLYFLKAGWWMLWSGLPASLATAPTKFDPHGVCLQRTDYTCVAASIVTMLRARGIEADEVEMAALAHVQVGGGATDSRALWALEHKLRGTTLRASYQRLDYAGLVVASKPCLVQLDWGYFMSHMVPVMEANERIVVVGDPLTGRREMTIAAFQEKWKGLAITLDSEAKSNP